MSRYTKAQRIADFYSRMEKLGFTHDETETLRLAQLTLHRWAERECNGEVERDEKTGKVYAVNTLTGERRRYTVPDRETGAWKRVEAVVSACNLRMQGITGNRDLDLVAYHQTDPRGCALYLVPITELKGEDKEHDISAVYNRGFGVCIG